MLRRKNGPASKRVERRVSWSAAGGVLAIALAVTLLRSPAAGDEKAADKPAAPAKVARRIEQSAIPNIPTPDNAQRPLFAREPFDPSIIPRAKDGAFLIRLGTLAKFSSLQPNIDMANHAATAFLRAWTKNAEIFLDLRQIDWIAGSFFAKITHRAGADVKGKFESGSVSIVIRLSQAGRLAGNDSAVRVTGVKRSKHTTGGSYVQLPKFPPMGDGIIRLHFPDDKTVIAYCLGDDAFFADLDLADADKNSRQPCTPGPDAWRAVDGGLLTVVYDQGKLESAATPADKKDWLAIAVPLWENAKYYAAGWDWSPKSQRTAVQVHGTCADREAVASLETAARALLKQAPQLLPDPKELFGKYQDQVLQMISAARLETSPADGDGHFVHATIEGPLTEKQFSGIVR